MPISHSPDIERNVTINYDQELYVATIVGGGVSTLGFDVCLDRIERITLELQARGLTVNPLMSTARGDLRTYDTYQILLGVLKANVDQTGERAVYELSPQLIGLEGWRVEVVDTEGDKPRRFIVGKSTGWAPCHLEISRRNAHGGPAARREYRHVRQIEKVR